MKKIQLFSAAFILLAASACEKEQQEVQNPISGELTTITAVAQESETKAYVDGLQVKWSAGDVLAVADEDDAAIAFPLVGGENTATATFNGDLSGKALGDYAVYPKGANANFSGSTVYTDYLTGWDYGKAEIPMYGINDGTGKYSFYNIGGALKVTYSNVPTEAKKFVLTETHTGGDVKYITGAVEVDDLDSTPSVELGYLDGQSVTVNNVTSGDLALVIPIPTGTGYNFNVKLIDADSKTIPGSEKNASNVQIKENKLKSFPEIAIPDSQTFFEERFYASTGSVSTFSGSEANGTFKADNAGWAATSDKMFGAGSAAKFGTTSVTGVATTPSISIPAAYRNQPVSLHFKAAGWSGDGTTLSLSVSGATCSASSVTLTSAKWKEFDLTLTSLSETISITFTPAQRFCLDDVIVFFGPSVPAEDTTPRIRVSTKAATSLKSATGKTATMNGNLTLLYDAIIGSLDEAGFYYKSGSGSFTKVTCSPKPTTTSFSYELEGLTPETEYTFKAYGIYAGGSEVIGEELTFTPTVALEAVYAVTSTSAVSSSGSIPTGATATYSSTYTTAKQLTKDKKMTLTLSGYDGKRITGLVLSMKSNSGSGSGYMSMESGSTTLASIGSSSSGIAFNQSSWNGAWSSDYVDVTIPVTPAVVGNEENLVIVVGATANSLYCQRFTITYE